MKRAATNAVVRFLERLHRVRRHLAIDRIGQVDRTIYGGRDRCAALFDTEAVRVLATVIR